MKTSETNLGICLGRILFSFLVVCCHCFSAGPGETVIKPIRGMAVPFFFIVSFVFSAKSISNNSGMSLQIRDRLLRIYRPFWFWGIVLAPFYAATILFPWSGQNGFSTVTAGIALQLLFGHVYDHPLWFLFLLGLFQGVFILVAKTNRSKQSTLCLLGTLLAISYFLQYSGINDWAWGRFPFSVKYPFGRIAECIPFAVAGVTLNKWRIVDKISSSRFICPFLLFLAILSWPLPIAPVPDFPGFEYAGLYKARVGAAAALFFFALPLSKLPQRLKAAIKFVSSFSLGVYCVHVPVGFALELLYTSIGFQPTDLIHCLFVFLISLTVCHALHLFSKGRLKPFVS